MYANLVDQQLPTFLESVQKGKRHNRRTFYTTTCYSLHPKLISEVFPQRYHEVGNAFVSQFPHVDLQGEESEYHEAEDRQRHYFGQLFERVKERVDDGLQA